MNGNLFGLKITALALAAAQAAGTVNDTGVDMRNAQGVGKFTLNASQPAAGTTLDVKLQHSDDNAAWADAGYAFAQATNAANYGLQELTVNADNLKRYVRTVRTVAGAGNATCSVIHCGIPQR
jgi:hypothetical protein